MTQKIKFEKHLVEQKLKKQPKILEKNSRQLRGRGFPPKKNQNSEDPSGSIRDITAHLIHDKNTSIAEPCIVFNEESVGYDPGWIYWSYEFLFFRPSGTLHPEACTGRTRRSKFQVPQVRPHDSM